MNTSLSVSGSGSSSTATSHSLSMTKKRRTTDDLLHWRRYQIVKLLAQGFTLDQTAEKLQVSPKRLQQDYAYIRHHAYEVIRNYLEGTVPNEMLKAIAGLDAVSDAAWAMAVRAKEKENNDKLEADALRLAKDTAIVIIYLITNNQSFVDAAFEVAAYDRDIGKQRRRINNPRESQEDDKKKEESNV